MIRYYKLKRCPGWYYKVVGAYARIICCPLGRQPDVGPISADFLIKNYELIELTEEQLFLELL